MNLLLILFITSPFLLHSGNANFKLNSNSLSLIASTVKYHRKLENNPNPSSFRPNSELNNPLEDLLEYPSSSTDKNKNSSDPETEYKVLGKSDEQASTINANEKQSNEDLIDPSLDTPAKEAEPKEKEGILDSLFGKISEISIDIKEKAKEIPISETFNDIKEKAQSYIPVDSLKESANNKVNGAKELWNNIDVKGTLSKPIVVEIINWSIVVIILYLTLRTIWLGYCFIKFVLKNLKQLKNPLKGLFEIGVGSLARCLEKLVKKQKLKAERDAILRRTSSSEGDRQVDETIQEFIEMKFRNSNRSESLKRFEEMQEKEERYYNYYRCFGCNERWETVTLGKGNVQMCKGSNCNYSFDPYHQIMLLNNKQMSEKFDSEDKGKVWKLAKTKFH